MYITVVSTNGKRDLLNISTLIGNSLQEALMKFGYRPSSRCAVSVKCRACLVQVIAGVGKLESPKKEEVQLLSLLHQDGINNRLACQLSVSALMNGLIIKLINKQSEKARKNR